MRQTTIFLQTEFAQTQVGDGEAEGGAVPDSSERIVGVTMRDLQQAAVEGVITNLQASKLWNRLVVSGIPVPNQAQQTKFVPSAGYLETAPQALLPMPKTRRRLDVRHMRLWVCVLAVSAVAVAALLASMLG